MTLANEASFHCDIAKEIEDVGLAFCLLAQSRGENGCLPVRFLEHAIIMLRTLGSIKFLSLSSPK